MGTKANPGKFDCYAKLAKRMGFNAILPALHVSEAKEIDRDPVQWMLARYEEIQATMDMDIAA